MKGKKTLFLLTATGLLTFVSLVGCGPKHNSKPADSSAIVNPSDSGGASNPDDSGSAADDNKVTGVAFEQDSFHVAPGERVDLKVNVTGVGTFDKRVKFSIPENAAGFSIDEEEQQLVVEKSAAVVGKSIKVVAASVADPTIKAEANVKVLDFGQGYADYTAVQGIERADILGALEKYAVDTHLTGITFMGNGGYVMYAENIEKGTNTYIPGYGFGVLAEGRITSPLTGPGVADQYKMYYHTYQADDPLLLNPMNSQTQTVSDLASYTAASYFDVQMSETKDSYVYVKDLSLADRPIPVGDPVNGNQYNTFKFPVKVGADLKYDTNSTIERFAAFKGREVQLQDYITPYQIYFTKAYGLKRSAENLTKASSIVGAEQYYNASADGFNAEAWKNVGIKAYVDENDGKSYLEVTLKGAFTPFMAMLTIGGSMFQPVPQDFILACGGVGNTDLAQGVKYWGTPNSDSTEMPGDHWLSTGPYTIEAWNKNQNIVYKKNPYYADRGRYQIAGVHMNILTAAKTDQEAAINEFLQGNLSAAGIPSTKLAQYKNDPRTSKTAASSTFKLNLNTCDEELWEELFGQQGSIHPHSSKSDYWDVKPAMSNRNFLNGLSYSVNRVEFCDSVGRVASSDYFADTYLIDPENGISYNKTDAHKAAVADSLAGTDGYGYSLELARKSFKAAAEEMIDNGDYNIGDKIVIESEWQEESDETAYGSVIKNYLETAFNSAETGLTLEVKLGHGATWDAVYDRMMEGCFDIGFGSISGDINDPLNFFEVLKSDNSSHYTLNWGIDTNEADGSIVYDDKVWSFDALWAAADHGCIVEDGCAVSLAKIIKAEVERKATGELILYLWVDEKHFDDDNWAQVVGVCLFACSDNTYGDYTEYYVTVADGEEAFNFDEEKGCYVITFPAELLTQWATKFPAPYAQGFDVYVQAKMNGKLATFGQNYYYLDDAKTVAGTFLGTAWEGNIPAIPAP